MNGTCWHLTRARKGHPPHFCEGFTTQADAETARAQFADQDVIHNRTGEMDNIIHPPEPFRTELTPAGEQTVIPGCERNFAPGKRQLDLFG